MINIACSDNRKFHALLHKEWLETDGSGGYASSTILHCHTRKYHGLFVVNCDDPGGRYVLLSKCEDIVSINDSEYHLSIHKYPMVYYPGEYHYLNRFVLDICPQFTYQMHNAIIIKELMSVHLENTLLIRYYVKNAPEAVMLKLKPLWSYRDIHSLARENEYVKDQVTDLVNGFSAEPYDGMPRVFMQASEKGRFTPALQWYRNFEYLIERDRGFAYQEDLFALGMFNCTIPPGGEIIFRISLTGDNQNITDIWLNEQARRIRVRESDSKDCHADEVVGLCLRKAARDFVVRNRKNKLSIMAGYHWFYEWGRDALISLPGLTLYTNRVNEGIEILKHIAELRRNGLVPNNISEKEETGAYNSVDASLWYFWCLQELLKISSDPEMILKEFWPVMIDMAVHYYSGTASNVSIRLDGLLDVGSATTQLTWMDATVNNIPVTPRYGCPVEINALWYNALCFVRHMACEFGKDIPFDIDGLIENITRAFEKHFWISEKEYLADTWMPGEDIQDLSVRPNQIFAISLPFPVVTDVKKMKGILRTVSEELSTPYGLRTLSPADPRYRGRYTGSPAERDAAYHQGTVWPWLVGHYGDAVIKAEAGNPTAMARLDTMVTHLEAHLYEKGIGSVSEIFNGDSPHDACGCIAQAWSVAELIRLKALIRG